MLSEVEDPRNLPSVIVLGEPYLIPMRRLLRSPTTLRGVLCVPPSSMVERLGLSGPTSVYGIAAGFLNQ
jgi:hypothetical protein